MKTIQLPRGWVAWVDDEDYERLAGRNWQVYFSNGNAYAFHRPYLRKEDGKDVWGSRITMHREIMGAGRGEAGVVGVEVDHIEHRGDAMVIDNRKSNLRVCSRSQNMRNTKKRTDGVTSCFKGVHWSKSGANHWMGMIGESENRRGRRHAMEVDAAIWYDQQALASYGDFARTNILGPHAMYASLPLSPNPDNSPLP